MGDRELWELQTILLRFALANSPDNNIADVYYHEVLSALGWQKRDIEKWPQRLKDAINQIDIACQRLEQKGLVLRVVDEGGNAYGGKLTDAGKQIKLRSFKREVK